jgi:hypothetical protein
MTDQTEFITVFRSADNSAEADATAARDELIQAGIQAVLLGADTPGVVEGSWEVRVPAASQFDAEALLAVEEPEPEDESEVPEEGLSHDLDFVNVFASNANDAEMEAISIQSILEASGIPTTVIGSAQFPSLGFEVRVPKTRLEEAQTLVSEARQSGAEVEGESA